MNKRLSDAIARVSELPEERQEAAAALLNDFLAGDVEDIKLTPEQIAEIEQTLRENDYATPEAVETFVAHFEK